MTPLFLLVGVLAGELLAHPLDPPTLLVVAVLATAWRTLGGRTLFVLVLALGLLAGASADREMSYS